MPRRRSVALAASLLALSAGPALGATVRGYDPGPVAAGSDPITVPPSGGAVAVPSASGSTARGVAVDAPPAAVEREPTAGPSDEGTTDSAGDPLVGNGLGGAMCRNP